MYDREIDGQEHTFGVSGKLIMNVMVMYDRQTDMLWSQLLGQAVEGPLTGTELQFVESLQTTWAESKALYPHTQALQKDYRGSRDNYATYYARSDPDVLGESHHDERLYVKKFVVGAAVDDEAKAYPFGRLNTEPVVNDNLGEKPLLVIFDVDSATAAVFDRELHGRTLNFRLGTQGGLTGARLVEEETGAAWAAFIGEGLNGPLAGTQLERVMSTSSFWFGWKDWYPKTAVYGVDG